MSAAELKLDVHGPRFRSSRARAYLVLALYEVRDGRAELAERLLHRARELEEDATDLSEPASPLSLVPRRCLQVLDDARTIVMPSGEVYDFSRRGPVRLMVLALARAATRGECLGVEELVEAGYPNETLTITSGRMRVHTAIRRLRNLGFDEVLLTRDNGYLLDPSIDVQLPQTYGGA